MSLSDEFQLRTKYFGFQTGLAISTKKDYLNFLLALAIEWFLLKLQLQTGAQSVFLYQLVNDQARGVTVSTPGQVAVKGHSLRMLDEHHV